MKGYVFVANSTKPNNEKANSREPVVLSNVNRPCVEAALRHGYEVFLGVNRNKPEELQCDYPVHLFDSHTYRSVTAFRDNAIALRNMNKIMTDNDIELIHCNTPVGGLIGRLCGKKHHIKTIIYTAHGFHFYKGAPLVNRVVFKMAERIMAHWTDVIITMNQEDYETARTFKLRNNGKVFKVHGVGINLSDYQNIYTDRVKKREELGLKENDIVFVSAGDIVPRKNYKVAIEAISKAKLQNVHYLICGVGPEMDKLRRRVKELGKESVVHFLGFRKDIKEVFSISDAFLFTSKQEGLPRSLMEAMAIGLPVVASNIRGNVDLIKDGVGGFLCEANDVEGFTRAIDTICENRSLREKMASVNSETIQEYDISVVNREIQTIYNEVLASS